MLSTSYNFRFLLPLYYPRKPSIKRLSCSLKVNRRGIRIVKLRYKPKLSSRLTIPQYNKSIEQYNETGYIK